MKAEDAIILDKSVIEERINLAQQEIGFYPSTSVHRDLSRAKLSLLNELLSISQPLLPYAEKCWNDGKQVGRMIEDSQHESQKQAFLNQDI